MSNEPGPETYDHVMSSSTSRLPSISMLRLQVESWSTAENSGRSKMVKLCPSATERQGSFRSTSPDMASPTI